jgi:hypothetical protein
MKAFYSIFIKPNPGVSSENIKTAMDLALDWYRVSETTWIVFSSSDADKLYARLKKYVGPKGRVLVLKVDHTDRNGFMPKDFWAWVNKNSAQIESQK